ncbi:hypothetical protein OQA88_10363 [Cercophora sp. LCS_1]
MFPVIRSRPRSLQPTTRCVPGSASSGARPFSACPTLLAYADTLPSLRIGSSTRVIFQGFTGKQATANAKDSIAWGTKIVGGVTPGRTDEHLGLPVLPTVREAVRQLKPDATAIYVAAQKAPAAIEEAIEAEIPLIVAVAEHIPLHEMLRIHSILNTQSKSRLVGPNSPGIISAIGRCRIGFQPLPCFSPGRVAIVAKSGTLSYETSTTRAGLGQSLCIGIGGDIVPGTNFRDALSVFEDEPDTDAIAVIGEIGGAAELEAADWIRDYRARVSHPKPIVGLIAGVNEVKGRIMGHAGAFTSLEEPSAAAKITTLTDAGVRMVGHPSKIGQELKSLLSGSPVAARHGFGTSAMNWNDSQRRHYSTVFTSTPRHPSVGRHTSSRPTQQRRYLYLTNSQSLDLLHTTGKVVISQSGHHKDSGTRRLLGIGIDRSTCSPCVLAAPSVENGTPSDVKRYPFDFQLGPDRLPFNDIAAHLQLKDARCLLGSLRQSIQGLAAVFYQHEAFLLTTHIVEALDDIKVVSARFGFDDAAFRVGNRHAELHELRDMASEDPLEVEAEKNGIAYLRLEGDGNIGTLVNGAGLAMNTVDALADLGGKAANFLDTGGKATSETVKKSFEVILQDPRVKVIFVNIFGGLTLGDMIARGVILAFQQLSPTVPVIVRIRGTNESQGQDLIAKSGLPLYAFDSFDEAATKAIELARNQK